MKDSIFSAHAQQVYSMYEVEFRITELAAGIPKNPKQMEAWLSVNLKEKSKATSVQIETIAALYPAEWKKVQETPQGEKRDKLLEALIESVGGLQGTAFKKTPDGKPYIEGRQIKAMLKEAASIALSGTYLKTTEKGGRSKSAKSFLAERIFVLEDTIPLEDYDLLTEETRVIHVPDPRIPDKTNSSFKPYEVAYNARIVFTLMVDADAEAVLQPLWPEIMVRAEQNGLGADRAMGKGRFRVTKWEKISAATPPKERLKATSSKE